MRLNLSLYQKMLVLIAVPLVFQLIFVGMLVNMLHEAEVERQQEIHSREVTTHVNELLRLLLEGGIGSISSRYKNPEDARNTKHFFDRKLKDESLRIQELVKGDASQEGIYDELHGMLEQFLQRYRQSQQELASGNQFAALKIFRQVNMLMKTLFDRADAIIQSATAKEQSMRDAQAQSRKTIEYLLYTFVAMNILFAIVLAMYFYINTARRLDSLMDNAIKLGSERELNPPLEGTDELARLDQLFRDMEAAISELRKKERATIENAIDVICSIDGEARFTAVSPASWTVWRYPAKELLGTRLAQILASEDVAATIASVRQIVKEKGQGKFEARIKREDGSLVDMLWSGQWSEKERALFCVAHDITERKQIERLKQDFVAMVSHDLRTPLTSVQAFLELLSVDAYGELNETGKESLEMTESNVSRLISLINDLLDIEKMESGMLELHVDEISSADLVNRSIHAVSGFASQQGVKLEIKNNEEVKLSADEDRLVQVIVNLLSNAIKFSPKGEPVAIDVVESDGWVEIAVIDRGRGVPQHLKESIFERFKQVERDDARKKGGSGLGLAICKAIIEQHGGTIGVADGDDGVGSKFWFKLPKSKVPVSKA